MICYIFGAMKTEMSISPAKDDMVIAADGGYQNLRGLKADYVVGDFDSLGYVPEREQILRHPVRKDDTDMMLAVKIGLEKGYHKFVILGGIGGRLDHTFANIQTLVYLDSHGAEGVLLSEEQQIYFLRDSTLVFAKESVGIVSVFAYEGKAEHVYLRNLNYELTDAILTPDFPLGVSNSFIGKQSEVCVKKGAVVVICEHARLLDKDGNMGLIL